MYDLKYAVGDFVDLAALIGYKRAVEVIFSALDDETMQRVVEELEDQYADANLYFGRCCEDEDRRSGVLEE
jgi:hypothetical protein